jgi:hypothetical protein
MIIDNFTTNHIIFSSNLLVNNNNNGVMSLVTIPSGEQDFIAFICSLPLNFDIVLTNVLGVPSFKVDLMSVSRFVKDLNCSVTFSPYLCIL